jgi:hypothetical protein
MIPSIAWRLLVAAAAMPATEPELAEPAPATPSLTAKPAREVGDCPAPVASATSALASVWAPPNPRGLSRVSGVTRPFLGLVGNTWGAISEARLEHYFTRPFMLGVEIAPLALAIDSNRGAGAITHLRAHAAYVTDYFSVGVSFGERLRRFGTSGLSLAPTLRLGSLDGLNLSIAFGYTVARNPYSGNPTLGFSHAAGSLAVPLTRRLAVVADAGLSLDIWVFATAGLRQRLAGDGGAGTWLASAAFGAAWVSDRTVCNFEAQVPCTGGSALSYGPTVSVGLERRF